MLVPRTVKSKQSVQRKRAERFKKSDRETRLFEHVHDQDKALWCPKTSLPVCLPQALEFQIPGLPGESWLPARCCGAFGSSLTYFGLQTPRGPSEWEAIACSLSGSPGSQGLRVGFCFSSKAGLPGGDESPGWGVFRFAVHFRELPCFLSCKGGFISLDIKGGWGTRATVRRAEDRLASRWAGSRPGAEGCPTSPRSSRRPDDPQGDL